MMTAAHGLAGEACEAPVESGRKLAALTLDAEIARLEDLATRNTQVSGAELATLRSTRDEILGALSHPRLRLDAIRLIWRA
jgi:ATP-dependent helicase HepA